MLPALLARLLQRVLYLWVRTTVLPGPPKILLDPDKPVCYVLQEEHLSDWLVLCEETRRAGLPSPTASLSIAGESWAPAVFPLVRRHRLIATPRGCHAQPPLMTTLLREARNDLEFDVQIVPVTLLWGRNPDRQKSAFQGLPAKNRQHSGYAGRIGRLLTILRHGRNVLVRFNDPISLRQIVDEGLDEARAVRRLARILRVHFRQQREMAIGPRLPRRHAQIETLLQLPAVRTAIDREAAHGHISPDEARQQAQRFALEIVSNYTYGVLRVLKPCFSWLWSRLYDGVEIYNIENVVRIAPVCDIVYIPAHRSHIDYLVLSYFLHQHGLTPPHIAAGANLNMPLVGSVLRRCGAFFLRRSFKGETLYTDVFSEYLHLLRSRGFPLEYFIEGGRSRSGRTLDPKSGILGMTIASFLRARRRPLAFIPVYLGYEKLIEGNTYLRELAGQPKVKESVWGLLQSVRKIRKIYGRVHVNFGEPMDLAAFLDVQRPGWLDTPPGDWPHEVMRETTRQTACALAERLNAAAVITPVGLIATVLLTMPQHTSDESVLQRMLAHYQALATETPYAPQTVACPFDPSQIVAYALRLGSVERVEQPSGSLIRIPDGNAPLLAYFRNNIIHLFVLPTLIAYLIVHNGKLSVERLLAALSSLYGLIRNALFLRWSPAEIPAEAERIITVLDQRGLLQRAEDGQLCEAKPNTREFAELRALGEVLRPDIERYFLALVCLQQSGSGCKTRQQLEEECRRLETGQHLAEPVEPTGNRLLSAPIDGLINISFTAPISDLRLLFDERLLDAPLMKMVQEGVPSHRVQ